MPAVPIDEVRIGRAWSCALASAGSANTASALPAGAGSTAAIRSPSMRMVRPAATEPSVPVSTWAQ